jgi:hypothetical protein
LASPTSTPFLLVLLLMLLLMLMSQTHPSTHDPVAAITVFVPYRRGPFPGDKMVQAHLCGRLPRDTLVVGLNPELPPSLLCMDVAYYFRLDGV